MGDFKETLNNCNEQAGEKLNGTYYECAICGRQYKNLEDRMACEAKCYKKRAEDEAAMKKVKLEEEKETRRAEIRTTYNKLENLVQSYVKDYGSLSISNLSTSKIPFKSDWWWF